MENTKEVVKSYILTEFLPGEQPDALAEETPLITGGILDSLATIKITSYLEKKYGINIEPHEMNNKNFNTINSISDFVHAKMKKD